MNKCAAEGTHWMEVKPTDGINLCRKHFLILRCGGKLKFKATVNKKDWRWIEGSAE